MSISAVNFCGTKTTDRGVPYYKSNVGLTAGAIAGGIVGGMNYAYLKGSLASLTEHIDDAALKDILSKSKKTAVPLALTIFAISTLSGAIVDTIRNKKAKEAADIIAFSDPQTVMMQEENIEFSKYGTPYYKSNNGKKFGSLLGIVFGLGMFLAGPDKYSPNKVGSAIKSIITGVIDGFIMGAITDGITNKKAKKDFLPKNYLV